MSSKIGNGGNNYPRPAVCARLRAARLAAELSQKQAAWVLGVARSAVRRTETGARGLPTPATLVRYASLYGTTVEALEGRA